jgi:hypothetical protein
MINSVKLDVENFTPKSESDLTWVISQG